MQPLYTSTGNKRTRPAAHIDMTPMVDLGFLLITFFIFTTSMGEERYLKLIMPNESGEPISIKQSNATTIVLGNNNLYYYDGMLETAVSQKTIVRTDLGKDGLRKLIMNRRQSAGEKMVVVIKPSPESDYGSLVNVLDEMQICRVEKWFLDGVEMKEYQLVKNHSR